MSVIDIINSDDKFRKNLDILDETTKKYGGSVDNSINDTLSVILKPETVDASKVEGGEGSKQYRPKTLDDYVGQEEAKGQILDFINGCKENNEPFPHTFLSAPPGHGKTLLANIMAGMLNKKLVTCTGGELKSEQQFIDKLIECNGGIIFIDECNRLNKKVGFFMLPIIEEFKINNKDIKNFTVIFATTHKGDLSKDLDALIQRCDLELELNHYSQDELITIVKHYKEKQYPHKKIPDNIYIEIAKNCKNTPRLARGLLRKYIFSKNWDRVMKNNKIVKDGLTQQDIKVLKFLNDFEKGVSKQSIANYLRIKPQTYEFEIEPYLVHKGFIIVEGKRKITNRGKEFLKCLV